MQRILSTLIVLSPWLTIYSSVFEDPPKCSWSSKLIRLQLPRVEVVTTHLPLQPI